MSVKHALLATLSDGPKFGLEMQREFQRGTGEVWPLNVGQVYTTLQRLERDHMVEGDDVASLGPRKGYRITPAGRRELVRWLTTPWDIDTPPRDELLMKVLVASRVPGVDVRDVTQAHRKRLVEAMQRYTHLKGQVADGNVGLALVIDAELFRLEGSVRWLDAADARLGHARTAGAGRDPADPTHPESDEANR